MSLFYNPLEMLRAEYNLQRGKNFAITDFVFGDPFDLRDFEGGREDGKNTMVIATVDGKKESFFYNRIDVNTAFIRELDMKTPGVNTVYRLKLDRDCVGSTKKLARPISRAYGIPIEEKDIVDAPFGAPIVVDQVATITFSKSSYLFLPWTSFSVVIEGTYLTRNGKCYTVHDNGGQPDAYAEDHSARNRSNSASWINLSLLTHRNDYTPAGHLLKRLNGNSTYISDEFQGYGTEQDAYLNELAKALQFCDGIPWANVRAANSAYNLHGLWVIYNGPVEDAAGKLAATDKTSAHLVRLMEMGDPSYDNVAICLASGWTTNTTQACMILHYNN